MRGCENMQFVVIAYDYTDEKAPERRLAVKEEHLKFVEKRFKAREQLFGGALLDDAGNMIGSVMVMDYPSKEELDHALQVEPYAAEKVWEKIDIKPYKVGPIFMELYK